MLFQQINGYKPDKIILNLLTMINELLQVSQRVDQQKPYFKVVEMKIVRQLFLDANQHADQPIFKKTTFKYDKYELAKVINFDQLQLLFRPFKNDASFKKTLLWNKITRFMPITLLLILIPQAIFIRPNSSNTVLIIWVICALFLFTLFFLIIFYWNWVINQSLDKLQDYCTSISQQQNDVQIQFIRNNRQKGWINCIFPKAPYFQVKSKTIEEDYKVVKLYTNTGFKLLSSNLNKPIFDQKSYHFDKNRLDKIISFEEFQLLFRPFKSNQAYQKTVFWGRCLIIVLILIYLSLVPLLLKKQGQNDIYLLIISLSIMFVIIFIFILIARKLSKLKLQLISDFIKFCQDVSSQHEKIEVIPHFAQSKVGQDPLKRNEIYCLQVKQKSV